MYPILTANIVNTQKKKNSRLSPENLQKNHLQCLEKVAALRPTICLAASLTTSSDISVHITDMPLIPSGVIGHC